MINGYITLNIWARYSLQAGNFLSTSQFFIWSRRNFGVRYWHRTACKICSILGYLFSSSYLTHFSTALYTSRSSCTFNSSFFIRATSWIAVNCKNSSSWQICELTHYLTEYFRKKKWGNDVTLFMCETVVSDYPE